MLKIKCFLILLFLFGRQQIQAQSIEITGEIEGKTDVENIHVINKTSKVFTITDNLGGFVITGKLNDTILFSSIQHLKKEIIVSREIMESKAIFVVLQEQINELDEVLVGKVLTGDLMSDIYNTEGEPPINFYDVGIPGYTGKIATQSERRLAEAGDFKPKMLFGLFAGGLPLNPILNGISGRTKMLKELVKKERNADLLRKIKVDLSEDFFSVYKLEEGLRNDFYFFCEEDPDFNLRCQNKGPIEIFEYLKEKLVQYKENLNFKKQ